MKKIEENSENKEPRKDEFYKSLPRFVREAPTESVDERLATIERRFNYAGNQFTMDIIPAQLSVKSEKKSKSKIWSRFPSDFEESLEQVLRRLAVPQNINFRAEKYTLWCTVSQLKEGLIKTPGESEDELRKSIETAVATLGRVNYTLMQGTNEFSFRPFEIIQEFERNGEKYFELCFVPIFFKDNFLWGFN